MSNFYPVNTPLINYYFYKAPFISNRFSVTNLSIDNAGSGYAMNDIIITAGGTYTSPTVLQVTGVGIGGIVLSVSITNNGQYTVSPTTFTQASTNGVGTGATFNGLIFSPSLHPPGPNIPLAGGFIFFYEDENRTVQANTYSDVSNPQNPTVNPNPIQLGSSGEYPLFYLDDRFYYIVITDYTGDQSNPVQVIEHYNPSEVLSNTSAFNDNFIVNPQFNYPIEFYRLGDDPGTITEATTIVSWSWEFLQDEKTGSENFVTFNNVAGQKIEGSPVFEVVLNSKVVDSGETTKDFRSYLGTVDFNQGNTLTFCAQMESKNGRNLSVNLYLEIYYGDGGSPTQLILLNTFTVGVTLNKYSFTFNMPSISGLTVGENSYSAIRVQPGIQQVCIFGMTNVMVVPGNQILPVFVDESEGFSKAQILGDSTDISNAGLYQNYSSYYYSNGQIFPYADTGAIVLCPTNLIQNFRAACNGSSRFINGYTTNNIPNQRLYNAIGTQFGSAGDLIVTSASNIVTFSSPAGARELSAYTPGTTSFTVDNTVIGLKSGFNLISSGGNLVTGTFFDEFAPLQTVPVLGGSIDPPFSNTGNGVLTYWGTQNGAINVGNITIITTAPGSGSTHSTFTLNFNSNNPADYQTHMVSVASQNQVSSFLDFAHFDNNIRQSNDYMLNRGIGFKLNGVIGITGQYSSSGNLLQVLTFEESVDVNFLSTVSMSQNIKTFIDTVANPFTWTVTVVSAPSESQYFLYSSGSTDYYGWFTVDGVGTDPAIGGRTGVEIAIATGQTTTVIAEIIAETINSAQFNVPDLTDLPALVTDSKVSWFINV